jgi:phosphoglycerate kinase
MGTAVGLSRQEPAALPACKEFLEKAHEHKIEVLFPVDYLVALGSPTGELITVNASQFPRNGFGMTLGPRSVDRCTAIFNNSNTIITNGLMGLRERPETLVAMEHLMRHMVGNGRTAIVGGGDSVSLLQKTNLLKDVSYVSTGGGAMLALLAGAELPGLKALYSRQTLNK